MPYVLYNLALYATLLLGLPIWVVLLGLRSRWRSGIGERLGRVPPRLAAVAEGERVVWLHAVSVGEVLAAVPLVQRLEQQFSVFVSTTTRTGQELARQRFGSQRVFYFPIDLGWAIQPYLRRIRPEIVVLMETEFWPNFLKSAHRTSHVAVVNARISDRSISGYRRWRWFIVRVLAAVDAFCAQTELDAARLVEIGAANERIQVAGNLKFDWSPPVSRSEVVDRLRAAIGRESLSPVVIAASTVEEEEELAAAKAFASVLQRWPQALCVIAPRHPQRFDEAAEIMSHEGFRVIRRTEWNQGSLTGSVLLLDTIGELASLYELADIAIVAGSFVPRGGHNVLEPAYFGKPIIVGPHTENFRDIVAEFQRADAIVVCTSHELSQKVRELAEDRALRTQLGQRARSVIQANTGATERTYRRILQLLEERR